MSTDVPSPAQNPFIEVSKEGKKKERKNMTRRVVIGMIGAGFLAELVHIIVKHRTSSAIRQDLPEDPLERMMEAVKSVEEKGYAKTEWFHPAGHEGGEPWDPVVLVPQVHGDPWSGRVLEKDIPGMHACLQTLLELERNGMRVFHCEGSPKGEKIPPYVLLDEGGNTLPSQDIRQRMQSFDEFRFWLDRMSQAGRANLPISQIFAGCSEDGTSVEGVESPAAFQEMKENILRARELRQKLSFFLEEMSAHTVIVEQRGSQKFVCAGDAVFEMDILLSLLRELVKVENESFDPSLHAEREEFAAAQHPSVLLFGMIHREAIRNHFIAKGRSVCQLLPVHMDPDAVNAKKEEISHPLQRLISFLEEQ